MEQDLNRVVVAACTPKIHEPTYRAVLTEAGISPYYFQMVNLREHCSIVHRTDKEKATEKAIRLVRAGINRARQLEIVPRKEIPAEKAVLVVGAGIAPAVVELIAQANNETRIGRCVEIDLRLRGVVRRYDIRVGEIRLLRVC